MFCHLCREIKKLPICMFFPFFFLCINYEIYTKYVYKLLMAYSNIYIYIYILIFLKRPF